MALSKDQYIVEKIGMEALLNQQLIILSDKLTPQDFSKKYAFTAPHALFDQIDEKLYRTISQTSDELGQRDFTVQKIPIIPVRDYSRTTNTVDIYQKFGTSEKFLFVRTDDEAYPELFTKDSYGDYTQKTPYRVLDSSQLMPFSKRDFRF